MSALVEIMLEEEGVIRRGHFIGASGRHLDTYVNKNVLNTNPKKVQVLGSYIAQLCAHLNIDVVASPAAGAVALGHEVAKRIREAQFVFTEKVSEQDGAGHSTERQGLKRGYDQVVNGRRVLVVEDIVTTGGSLLSVVDARKKAGGIPVGASAIVNRSPGTVGSEVFGVPFIPLLNLDLQSWSDESVPDVLKRVPIDTSIGHGAAYVANQHK